MQVILEGETKLIFVNIELQGVKKLTKKMKAFYLAYFIALGFLVFSLSMNNQSFIFDDGIHLKEARNYSWTQLLLPFQETVIPVFYLVVKLVSLLFNDFAPIILKALNLIFHSLNSYILFRMFKIEKDHWATFVTLAFATIFLLHPINLESILWWSSIKGTLALFLGLIAGYSLQRNSYLSIVFILLSLFVKPIIITFTLPLIYYSIYIREKKIEVNRLHIIALFISLFYTLNQLLIQNKSYKGFFSFVISPYVIASLFICYAIYRYRRDLAKLFNENYILLRQVCFVAVIGFLLCTLLNSWLFEKYAFMTNSIFHYIKKIIFDFNYYFDYGVTKENFQDLSLRAVPFLSSIILISYLFIIRSKQLFILLLSLFLLLLPNIGLFTTRSSSISFVSDRYAYNFLFFGILFVGDWIIRLNKRYLYIVVIAMAPFVLMLNLKEQKFWVSSKRLLTKTYQHNDKSYPTIVALANLTQNSFEQYLLYKEAFTLRPYIKQGQTNFVISGWENNQCHDLYATIENTIEGQAWTLFTKETLDHYIRCLRKIKVNNLHMYTDYYSKKF